ncbi:MAG: DISARM system helicase DrmA [Dehalococcoidia bacterium]|nr:DISARM system helicase DrmA [Dehalococcoidia bacterium]
MTQLPQSEADYPTFEGDLARDRLLAALRYDLLGPEGETEVLAQSPKTRYLVGMLAPRGTQIDEVEDDQNGAGGESDEGDDGTVALAATLEASSIGISIVVSGEVSTIHAVAEWGEYTKTERIAEDEVDPAESGDLDRDEDPDKVAARRVHDWTRTPRRLEHEIDLTKLSGEYPREAGGVRIRYLVRPYGGDRIVSAFLDNQKEPPVGKRPPDEDYLFQPSLRLTSPTAAILPRGITDQIDRDPDIASADLIYRKRLEFGVGHGVAVHWDESEARKGRVSWVRTEMIPAHEVPKVTPRESDRLSMDELASAPRDEVKRRLNELIQDYSSWLSDRGEEKDAIHGPLKAVATDHLQLAARSRARMISGIQALDDGDVFAAFQFANEAMAIQRRHSVQIRDRQRGRKPPSDDQISARWRPFQLGFMLQALAGLADPEHSDREIADLLWFPTGGGKTEAYLGLTAFILAFRRLRRDERFDNSAGTSVIMRYTLRLLTIQQFQRALALMAACEFLRLKEVERWGAERFTIGLWVGTSVSPNSYEDAKTALNKLKNDQEVYEKSPYQILYCPWCGRDLSPRNYIADDDTESIYIKCFTAGDPASTDSYVDANESETDCIFHTTNSKEGIPALVVDQQIYRNPPSLLLATVDKFAQMTWNGRIQSLFGRVERRCPRHGFISAAEDQHAGSHQESISHPKAVVAKVSKRLAPPDLIIQDELHLISGPLGTLVGLYESAVESLCSYENAAGEVIRPKVIASTATIRRAKTQVRALYDRDVGVFPPLGLDAADSFFATESDSERGRLYVGVFGPGKSIKTTLVRTYGALLGRANIEFERQPSEETDAYMTLVGYFNSLRELGGAVRLVEDDVRGRLRTLKRRGFADDRVLYEGDWELTSRKSSSRISTTLKALERTFLEKTAGSYPIDLLLSSNMISVGVDIDRLGLMVVSGQPKTTAEYIQATSRVGRMYPGLVVQVYNWIRPRDISHYERFHHYHSTFHRHVEATSATPFSERARDRALQAVLVARARLGEPTWSREPGAGSFDKDQPEIRSFVDSMVERGRSVARHGDEVAQELRSQLEHLIFRWEQMTKDPNGLVYSARGQDKAKSRSVLLRPMELDKAQGEWQAAGSLREVEEEVVVVLKDHAEDE